MPVASSYLNRLGQRLTDAGVPENRYIMQSNGGTTTFDQAKPISYTHLLSGIPVDHALRLIQYQIACHFRIFSIALHLDRQTKDQNQ